MNNFKKSNEKFNNLFNNEIGKENIINKNIIKGELFINEEDLNKKICLFNTDIKDGIDVLINNKKIKMIMDNDKWIIDYNFEKYGKYSFEIFINKKITSLNRFF